MAEGESALVFFLLWPRRRVRVMTNDADHLFVLFHWLSIISVGCLLVVNDGDDLAMAAVKKSGSQSSEAKRKPTVWTDDVDVSCL